MYSKSSPCQSHSFTMEEHFGLVLGQQGTEAHLERLRILGVTYS
jgi:hypothetical protein